MKAVTYYQYGSPDVLRITALPTPSAGKKEIRIRVVATTVNRTDCAILLGKPYIMRLFHGLTKPRRTVPGTDFAGIVEETGEGVTEFKRGDRVWGFDDNGLASQAEYMTLPVQKPVVKIPDNVGFEKAVASAEGAHYAYNFINKVTLIPGQRVLVNGATGAIGSAAVQLLKERGVHVTAVCHSDFTEVVMELGANEVIDYTREDFTKGTNTYHFVFDSVGKRSYPECRKVLTPDGIYISSELGPYSQNLFLSILSPVKRGRKIRFPFPFNIKRSLHYLSNLLQQEKFKPLIDRRYDLNDVQDAYRYVLQGQKIGNVVLSVGESQLR